MIILLYSDSLELSYRTAPFFIVFYRTKLKPHRTIFIIKLEYGEQNQTIVTIVTIKPTAVKKLRIIFKNQVFKNTIKKLETSIILLYFFKKTLVFKYDSKFFLIERQNVTSTIPNQFLIKSLSLVWYGTSFTKAQENHYVNNKIF